MSVVLTRGRVPRTPHTEFYSEPEVLALEEIHGGRSNVRSRAELVATVSFFFSKAAADGATLFEGGEAFSAAQRLV